MIDLKPFCGTDPFRAYLHQPFSFGEFTYATNGHIAIRVPRLPDAPEQEKTGKWDAPFNHLAETTFSRLSHRTLSALPEPREEDCEECNGRGREHSCPDCECVCENCDGSGKEMVTPKVSTTVRGVSYNLRYIAMMLALPNVEVATSKKGDDAPLLFRFDGGVGALMPMRSQYEDHIEIEIDKAA